MTYNERNDYMTNEEVVKSIEWLKSLGEKMKIQDTDEQAAPRFWVVAEEKKTYGFAEDYAEGTELISCDGYSYDDVDEDYRDDDEFEEVGFCVEPNEIVRDTLFITKDSCKEYIDKYGYNHYKPHTYAMTAVRSPEVKKLFELLQNEELWEKLKEAVDVI